MIVDAHQLEPGQTLRCDLCIIGAGAAGIAIARDFAGRGVELCLLEAGGEEYSEASQAIYKGPNVGISYHVLDASRLRYFGGSTNSWNGRCQPLSDIDFRKRPWIPESGWPITKKELEPYYHRAQLMLKLGPYGYEEEDWKRLGFRAVGVDRHKLNQILWQLNAVRFGEAYGGELKASGNVRIVLYANVTNIQAGTAGSMVSSVDFCTLEGRKGRVVARTYVLACGGIENARLLLISDGVHENGLGNRHGLVGRFFTTHPRVSGGEIDSAKPEALIAAFGHWRSGKISVFGGLSPSDSLQEEQKILNAGVRLKIKEKSGSGIAAARAIKRYIKAGKLPDEPGRKLWRVIRDVDDVAVAMWRQYRGEVKAYGPDPRLSIELIMEQEPRPDCRVVLTRDRDALGLPRAALDLRLNELHKRSALVVTRVVAAEISRLGLGRVRLADWLREGGAEQEPKKWSNHHIGTTRMADDPRRGVTDADCRVHGLENLYIAGSSVFPTGGIAGPMLTTVALALRLADHLKKRLA